MLRVARREFQLVNETNQCRRVRQPILQQININLQIITLLNYWPEKLIDYYYVRLLFMLTLCPFWTESPFCRIADVLPRLVYFRNMIDSWVWRKYKIVRLNQLVCRPSEKGVFLLTQSNDFQTCHTLLCNLFSIDWRRWSRYRATRRSGGNKNDSNVQLRAEYRIAEQLTHRYG